MTSYLSEQSADQKSYVSGQATPWISVQTLGAEPQGQPQSQAEGAVTHPLRFPTDTRCSLQRQQKLGTCMDQVCKALFACLFVGSVSRLCFLGTCVQAPGGRGDTDLLPGWLWSVSIPVLPTLLKSHPKVQNSRLLSLKPGLWATKFPNGCTSRKCPEVTSMLAIGLLTNE